MASITWARLATLTIEDRQHTQPWYEYINYTKPADEDDYELYLQAQTVSQSPLLVLIFVVHPVLVIAATAVKAYLYTIPVSDGVGIISLLSSANPQSLPILRGAGYSGELDRVVQVRFTVGPRANLRPDNEGGRVCMHLDVSDRSDGSYNLESHFLELVHRAYMYE